MKLDLTESEISKTHLSDEILAKAVDIFLTEGALWINSVIPLDILEDTKKAIKSYIHGIEQRESDHRNLKVGDMRYMEPIKIEYPFSDCRLFCPQKVHQILIQILGDNLVLDSYTTVISLPGAKLQHVHSDGPTLFGDEINVNLPPHAVTLAVPLVDLDEVCGSTGIWYKSHLYGNKAVYEADGKKILPAQYPTPKLGDVYMFDYRIKHAGMPNQSDYARPILYIVFSRPWWSDSSNFSGACRPVNISANQLHAMPNQIAPLFRNIKPV